ncbi:MAG: c-type cytochrome [Acidobacteriota bacterium]|nr:c-type cytochrome [Acidobacteriota bacterium]
MRAQMTGGTLARIMLPIPALLAAAPVTADGWLPEAAAQVAETVDLHFTVLMVFAATVFLGLLFALDVILFMNLRRDDDQVGRQMADRGLYRGLAVLLSLVFVVAVFAMGVRGYLDASVAPTDALTVEALRGPEGLTFRYSADVETDELHVPSERPVRLTVQTADAPVSVTIPAFRVRRNAKAGVSTEAWFAASQPGSYELLSAGPSLASSPTAPAVVTVHSAADFDQWLMSKSDILLTLPPLDAGRVLVERKGCLVCHTVDGSPLTGPSFQGLMGRESRFADGSSQIADGDYVRRSILDPTSQVVEGFEPVMPPFAGQIRDAEIDAIITYLESLSDGGEAL